MLAAPCPGQRPPWATCHPRVSPRVCLPTSANGAGTNARTAPCSGRPRWPGLSRFSKRVLQISLMETFSKNQFCDTNLLTTSPSLCLVGSQTSGLGNVLKPRVFLAFGGHSPP